MDAGRVLAWYLSNPLYSNLTRAGPYQVPRGVSAVSKFLHGQESRAYRLCGIQNNLVWSSVVWCTAYTPERIGLPDTDERGRRRHFNYYLRRTAWLVSTVFFCLSFLPAVLRLLGFRPAFEISTPRNGDILSLDYQPLRVEFVPFEL